MTQKTSSYRERLLEDLKDPQEAAHYINAAIEDGSGEMLLLALRDVAEAHHMSKVARGAQVQRESIYRILSRRGNPRLTSLWGVVAALGLKIVVEPIPEQNGLSLASAGAKGLKPKRVKNRR